MVGALTGLDWGRTVRAVRVNGIDTPWCHGDIIEVVTGARECVDVLIVPKVRRARDVWWVDVLLGQLEASLGLERPIGLEVLIEEAEGLANALEIAQASERLEALIFGAGDLAASLHARVDGNFDPVVAVPGRLLALRPRAGADGGPGRHDRRRRRTVPRLPGPRGLPAVGLGRRARSATTANGPSTRARCRSPTRCSPRRPKRSPRPKRPCAVYREAEAGGVGAIGRDGTLVDAAHMRLAANTLHKASLAGGG